MNIPVVTSGAVGGILRLADSDADTGTRTSGGGPLGGRTIPVLPNVGSVGSTAAGGVTPMAPPTGRPPV